jgi:2-octaprenyl-6-methoxyphenol hydroxylase
MPPIGAQGLNLGLRDAATIGELVVAARRDGADVGSDDLTHATSTCVGADVTKPQPSRSICSTAASYPTSLPLHGARGLGLYLLDRIGPLRRAVMREGVAPAAPPSRG